MKRFNKKAIWGLLAVSLLALGACGQGDSKGSSDGGSKNGKQTLTVTIDGERYEEFVNKIKGDFEKENNVEIKIKNSPMIDQLEALPLDGPAGLAADVMMAPYDRAGSLGQQGHLLELKVPDDGRYDERTLSMAQLDNKQYAAPFIVETLVLFYNKDLMDKVPESFAGLEELSKDKRFAFKGESGKNVGFLANWIDFNQAYGLIAGYGGYVFGDEGKNVKDIGINNKGAVEGIEYISKWYENVWPQGMKDAKGAGDFKNQSFINGDTAANIAGTWMTGDFKESDVNLGIAPIPTLPNGESYQPFAGGKGWIASAYTKEPELAQKWVDYVTGKENSTTFYEITSELPVNKEVRAAISAEGKDELAVAVYDQFDHLTPMPIVPEMAEVWTGAQTMLFDAVSGNKTAQESADDAVKVIESAIKEKY